MNSSSSSSGASTDSSSAASPRSQTEEVGGSSSSSSKSSSTGGKQKPGFVSGLLGGLNFGRSSESSDKGPSSTSGATMAINNNASKQGGSITKDETGTSDTGERVSDTSGVRAQ